MSQVKNAVLITGGGQRIGAYLVRQFIQQTDYPVVFTYRTPRAEVDELVSLGAIAIQCDFTAQEALPGLVEIIKEKVVSIRAIIHNASLWLNDKQAPPFSEEYRALFKVHVEAPIFLNQNLHSLLLASNDKFKDIISLSDYSVSRVTDSHIAYLSSKSALQTVSKGFAKQFAPNIKVNDIAPALIQFNQNDDEEYKKKRLNQSAIPIEPGAEVIWQAVDYLMNSSYTTGSILQLDGGRHLL
jgi:dihydromonapterin reductase/dihydrofolate reductase